MERAGARRTPVKIGIAEPYLPLPEEVETEEEGDAPPETESVTSETEPMDEDISAGPMN